MRDEMVEVYPRTHGEAEIYAGKVPTGQGLSPHTRGSHNIEVVLRASEGSIPAHTGKPYWGVCRTCEPKVYPRTHGEATRLPGPRELAEGLSPHTRGSPRLKNRCAVCTGSIPAHTGKPKPRIPAEFGPKVYPRTHGEAGYEKLYAKAEEGLSPHTRGSLSSGPDRGRSPRSIPAHTGKPSSPRPGPCATRVYPRTHGEAYVAEPFYTTIPGLSPHTRGSHRRGDQRQRRKRSIPAHTGKPQSPSVRAAISTVYPRTHGEAPHPSTASSANRGLSPHTRGSRGLRPSRKCCSRSIPAHTGKPRRAASGSARRPVYPRTHGEAVGAPAVIAVVVGLSPHTRGSPPPLGPSLFAPRSIPAHTGKPAASATSPARSRVYPRTHGEARVAEIVYARPSGLSPHTRGSRVWIDDLPAPMGSIPAHTGKPTSRRCPR